MECSRKQTRLSLGAPEGRMHDFPIGMFKETDQAELGSSKRQNALLFNRMLNGKLTSLSLAAPEDQMKGNMPI